MNQLREMFCASISATISDRELDISSFAKEYVVELASDLNSVAHGLVPDPKSLPQMMAASLEIEGAMRRELLRTAGDSALLVSGFFPDSLDRNSQLSVYMELGRKAYSGLSGIPFEELADLFPDIVVVLNTVGTDLCLLSNSLENYLMRRKIIDDQLTRR